MFRKISQYLRNVRIEMNKVTWPSRPQLIESTSITLVLALLLAIFIFIADNIITRIIGIVI